MNLSFNKKLLNFRRKTILLFNYNTVLQTIITIDPHYTRLATEAERVKETFIQTSHCLPVFIGSHSSLILGAQD